MKQTTKKELIKVSDNQSLFRDFEILYQNRKKFVDIFILDYIDLISIDLKQGEIKDGKFYCYSD